MSSQQSLAPAPGARTARGSAPVFIVGSPRSGTTLMYHLLLSAGDFAIYHSETHVFDLLVPRFGGNLRDPGRKEALLDAWLPSSFFQRSGLDPDRVRRAVMEECRTGGDILRVLMQGVADEQGARRWSDCTPKHILHMREIKRAFPDALFLHMIRDGRDVALSLERQGWIRPFPWDRGRTYPVAGLFWEWMLERGRAVGRELGGDYLEVRFEDIVLRPEAALERIGRFIEHDLDYERIQRDAVGSVARPNTSFQADAERTGSFSPVGRWRELPAGTLAEFEALLGATLRGLGYETGAEAAGSELPLWRLRNTYRPFFTSKQWLKANTPAGRWMTDTSLLRPRP